MIAYGIVLAISTILWRLAGWVEWGSTLRAFANAITNGYAHLVSLSHRWHTDRPAGEVISTLETFSWAFVELLDTVTWGFLRIAVTCSAPSIVLAIVAWPVAPSCSVSSWCSPSSCGAAWRRVVVGLEGVLRGAHEGDRRRGRHHRQPDDRAHGFG